MVVESLIMPFMKKVDLEKRKNELKKAIGALSRKKDEPKLKELKRELKKIEKAEEVLKKPLPTFYFWYCSEKAANLAEFAEAIQKAPINSLNHHAEHHDFSNWLNKSVPQSLLVMIKEAEKKRNEELRKALLHAIEKFAKKKLGIN
ncbi:MAG: hypothetical protein J7J87_03135 [Candidatus Diapherotrites archaeon]|nr:hypothetical protein [Candidatus Diapherotrites archaeon]